MHQLESGPPADHQDGVGDRQCAVDQPAPEYLVHRIVASDVLTQVEQLAVGCEQARRMHAAGAREAFLPGDQLGGQVEQNAARQAEVAARGAAGNGLDALDARASTDAAARGSVDIALVLRGIEGDVGAQCGDHAIGRRATQFRRHDLDRLELIGVLNHTFGCQETGCQRPIVAGGAHGHRHRLETPGMRGAIGDADLERLLDRHRIGSLAGVVPVECEHREVEAAGGGEAIHGPSILGSQTIATGRVLGCPDLARPDPARPDPPSDRLIAQLAAPAAAHSEGITIAARTSPETPAAAASRNTWIEIDRNAYRENLRFFRRLLGPDVELAVVVKANAYGHGLECIAALAARGEADSFCVHSLEEALVLRAAGHRADILVLGHVPLARLEAALAADLRLALFARPTLERLDRLTRASGRRARVHLKLETGTHRHGIDAGELDALLAGLKQAPGVDLEGVYTHFANIEDTTNQAYAREQVRCFEALVARIASAGFTVTRRHAACSAAALVMPETRFEMVRLGIAQFGLWPSPETLLSHRAEAVGEVANALAAVLCWKTRVTQVKAVPAGAYVGYGCSYQTTRPSRLAVLPIGYSDGYDRRLSNQAHALVRGQRAPIRGRICMNLCLIDVTDISGVVLGDEVVLLGRQGEEIVRAEQLAAWAGTIHYEVVARLRAGIPRFVVGAPPAAGKHC